MPKWWLALAVGLLTLACGAPSAGGDDAATAAARIKGGLESQAGAVQAFSTQAAAAASQAQTQVPGAVSTAVAAATAAPGAVSTAVAVATAAPGAAATVAAAATQAAGAVAKVAAAATQGAPAVATAQAAAGAAVKGATGMTPEQIGPAARAEAARALNVPPDQVTVERVERVDWRDSSLGCSEPGKAYAQVIIEGFRVVVNVGGQRREVHADEAGRRLVFCQNPTQ